MEAVSGRLSGKSAVITGGAAGMGRAASLLFAQQGARVAILDIQKEAGTATTALIERQGGEALFIETDVTRSEQVTAAFDHAEAEHGTVDVLFSHAGTIIVKPFHDCAESDYDRLMDINVRSAFLACREGVTRMLASGNGGAIVVTSSIAGEKGFAFESLYSMTKGAVLQLARAISTEYRQQGIRANAVCPGFVKTAHGLREIDELDGLGQTWEDAALEEAQVRIWCARRTGRR